MFVSPKVSENDYGPSVKVNFSHFTWMPYFGSQSTRSQNDAVINYNYSSISWNIESGWLAF